MEIKEAVELVIKASEIGKGGDIMILDMGTPVNIYNLAQEMILASGKDLEIQFSEPIPGEKLKEELFNSWEIITDKKDKILIAKNGL